MKRSTCTLAIFGTLTGIAVIVGFLLPWLKSIYVSPTSLNPPPRPITAEPLPFPIPKQSSPIQVTRPEGKRPSNRIPPPPSSSIPTYFLEAQACPNTMVAVSRVKPIYPAAAIAMGLPGKVIIKAYLNREGIVKGTSSVECSSPIFFEPARYAVMEWRFSASDSTFRNCEYCYKTVVVSFVPDAERKN